MFYNRAIELIGAGNLSRGVEILYQTWELAAANQKYLDVLNAVDEQNVPDAQDVIDVLGLCLFAQGKFIQAKVCWEHSEKNHSERYQKYFAAPEFVQYVEAYNECLQAVEKGKHLKGLLKLMPALESLPNVEGYNLAGLLFYQLGMKKSAMAFWRKSLNIDLSDGNAAYYLAYSGEGWLPLTVEKILWEVYQIAAKLKLS